MEIRPDSGNMEEFPFPVNISDNFDNSSESSYISYYSNQNATQRIVYNEENNYALFLSFLVISSLIVLINARVFYVVTVDKRRKLRPVNIFVAHLSSTAIGFTFVLFIYVLEKSNVSSMTAPGLCELLSFLRNGMLCVFPLNAMGIIYVRVTSSTSTLDTKFCHRAILIMWIIALFGSLPSVLMVEYRKDPITQQENCKQIPLLKSYKLTIGYEVFRFFTFHLFECFYMAFALFQIRSKIRYLYIHKPIPNDRTKRKFQRIRYTCVHSIIFILIWLPTGVGIGIYKVLCRQRVVDEYLSRFLTPLIFLSTSLYILSPLIYLVLHEDMSEVKFWKCSIFFKAECIVGKTDDGNAIHGNDKHESDINCQNENNQPKSNSNYPNEMSRPLRLHETTDFSRFSSIANCPTPLLSPSKTGQTHEQNPSSGCNLPTAQTTSTSKPTTSGSVDCKKDDLHESSHGQSTKFVTETPV